VRQLDGFSFMRCLAIDELLKRDECATDSMQFRHKNSCKLVYLVTFSFVDSYVIYFYFFCLSPITLELFLFH
jgi:hypothetical protein